MICIPIDGCFLFHLLNISALTEKNHSWLQTEMKIRVDS